MHNRDHKAPTYKRNLFASRGRIDISLERVGPLFVSAKERRADSSTRMDRYPRRRDLDRRHDEGGDDCYLITGDSSRNKLQTMPGGGFETVRIELPKAWDQLMEEAGYQPLQTFEL